MPYGSVISHGCGSRPSHIEYFQLQAIYFDHLLKAGPRLLVRSAVTTDKPTKPTPTNRPLFNALLNLIPIQTPKIVKIYRHHHRCS